MTHQFSIIIPVYNVEQYLRECLDSVVNQDFDGDYEVLCVNDGSTDGSLNILEEYQHVNQKIRLINQTNKGLSEARNRGIDSAKGEYLLFLDSDDWLEPDALKILSQNIIDEDFVAFNGKRYFEDGSVEQQDNGIVENSLTGWEYYNKYALTARKFHFVCVVLRIYKRKFLLDNHLFFKSGLYHEDNLFTPIACYYASKIKVIPDTLYLYRIRKGSISQTPDIKRLTDIIHVANRLADFFIPKVEIDKSVVYREIAGEYFSVFLPDRAKIYNNDYSKVDDKIDWQSYKTVSTYPRHKKIYKLIVIHPTVFRLYLYLEQKLKLCPTRLFTLLRLLKVYCENKKSSIFAKNKRKKS